MTERQLASILYRDNSFMKHAERKRLQSELENQPRPPVPKRVKVSEGGSPVAAALIPHLLQAGHIYIYIHTWLKMEKFPEFGEFGVACIGNKTREAK